MVPFPGRIAPKLWISFIKYEPAANGDEFQKNPFDPLRGGPS